MNFRCHGCGACCIVINTILDAPVDQMEVPETVKESIRNFPYKTDDKGWCEKLGADFKCTVYEDRPLMCRVEDYYNELEDKPLLDVYYKATEDACKMLMEDTLGMSEEQIKKVYDDI